MFFPAKLFKSNFAYGTNDKSIYKSKFEKNCKNLND